MEVGEAAIKIRDELAATCARAGSPLDEAQQTLIVGGLAIWLDWYALKLNPTGNQVIDARPPLQRGGG